MEFNLQNIYASYINLPHRNDRRVRMQRTLTNAGIVASRSIALKTSEHKWDEHKIQGMIKRGTIGAIGCHYSQIAVIKDAYKRGKHAFVMEDDLEICLDFKERMAIAAEFLNNNSWDTLQCGATFHKEPTWHKLSKEGKHAHPDMQVCNCDLNKDWEPTDNKHIVRTYGCWSTYAYIVNYNSIPRILRLLDDNVHLSMGIDWLFMYLSPQMKQYAFVPGCVKQYDNQSDIGTGITKFSAFKGLGGHWWKNTMKEFDYNKFHKSL